jgi:hypothetical protein
MSCISCIYSWPGIRSCVLMAVFLCFTTGVLLCTTVCCFTILCTVALESRRYSTLACYLFYYCLLLYYCASSIQILHELHLLVFLGGGSDLRQGAEICLFLFVVLFVICLFFVSADLRKALSELKVLCVCVCVCVCACVCVCVCVCVCGEPLLLDFSVSSALFLLSLSLSLSHTHTHTHKHPHTHTHTHTRESLNRMG